MYDAIIIGAGPGGLNAGLYMARSGYRTLILESTFVGGQVSTTFEVDNYLGFHETIDGASLVNHMKQHARKFGVEMKREKVTELFTEGDRKKVITSQETYEAPVLILSMGTRPRLLGIPGETELRGMGVSYCATCDGAFFRNRDVCVVGGGDTALEDALFLEKYCNSVTLIHRRDAFRAVKSLVDRVEKQEKIHRLYNTVVTDIKGDGMVTSVTIKEQNSPPRSLDVSGVFVAVGTEPQTQLVQDKIALTPHGYILTNDRMETNVPGIFACGDIREKPLRQIITAAADGAVAAYSASLYLVNHQ